ncbi:hypothetical protein PIB30_026128 [Stylosanthes scabra]|uniref:Uncharacterized protein n=1 Tax=Stylosanthes scabra TaxID=79078 RepID=A0ABU6U934_9FABA|nr:hypothetical protein [Stylosanthes scabra]
MRDRPPRVFQLPALPEEANLPRLRDKLTAPDFIKQISKRWEGRGCMLFCHFGNSIASSTSLDWTIKVDAKTGEASTMRVPVGMSFEGWFQVIGVDKGVFCLKFSSSQLEGGDFLVTWNPTMRTRRPIDDPVDL